jgi:Peptidase M50B-like
MPNNLFTRVVLMLTTYLILRFFGGSFGALVLYPVTLLVTYLHEFGHALGAILTGGGVEGMQINLDGSGYTVTRGGKAAVILIGGYMGSIFLGNLLLWIGVKRASWARSTLLLLAVLMLISAIGWYESSQSSLTLLIFAALLYLLATRSPWGRDVVLFFGLATVLYIIQDFNVGPRSDLVKYEEAVGLFSHQVWMYLWLAAAVLLTYGNVREIFSRG